MANVVSKLKTALGQGARSSKFKINLNIPQAQGSGGGEVVDTLCTQSTFPGIQQTPIEVFQKGRKLVLPGETQYESTWTLTFYQTEEHDLRKDFIAWMKAMDNFEDNKHQGDFVAFMTEATVSQLNHDEAETQRYIFKGLFPSDVQAVQVSATDQGQVETFDVTFAFTNWVVVED